MRILRTIAIGLGWLALILCAAGVIGVILLAPSRDRDRLGGVQSRGAAAQARIPLLGLACAAETGPARAETCTTTVAGQPLRVMIAYDARSWQGFAACRATLSSVAIDCQRAAGWSRYAVIDADALGPTDADLRATARLRSTEGWREADWRRLPLILAGLAALGVALLIATIPTATSAGRLALIGSPPSSSRSSRLAF